MSVSEFKPNDVIKRLDDLYSNRKYSELDLGSAVQILTMRANEIAETPAPSNAPAK